MRRVRGNMNTIKRRRFLSLLLVGILSFGTISQVSGDYADDIAHAHEAKAAAEERLAEANAQIAQAEADKAAAEAKLNEKTAQIATLKAERDTLSAYLADLNTQLNDLANELTRLNEAIDLKQVEIEMTKAAVERAKLDEENQYEDMKVRIQYMYERGGSDLIVALMDAASLTDFLNRAAQISEISSYDRERLIDFGETKEAIIREEQELEAEEAELEALKAQSEAKKAEVQLLAETTDAQIAVYVQNINDEEYLASNLQNEIDAQRAHLKDLSAQVAAQEAARAEAERLAAEAEELARKKAEEEKKAAEEAARKAAEQAAAQAAQAAQTSSVVPTGNVSAEGKQYLGHFKLTAYCACSRCCGRWGTTTASGTYPTPGRTVAMAGVPFGTKLLINGIVYTVEDRGTAYGHVDIFMNDHGTALRFGLRYADVYLVG